MASIDTGPMLLGILLVGSIVIGSLLHLFFRRHLLASAIAAVITVVAVFALDSLAVGFFNEQLLLGVVPGLAISFAVSYVVWGVFWIVRKRQS